MSELMIIIWVNYSDLTVTSLESWGQDWGRKIPLLSKNTVQVFKFTQILG